MKNVSAFLLCWGAFFVLKSGATAADFNEPAETCYEEIWDASQDAKKKEKNKNSNLLKGKKNKRKGTVSDVVRPTVAPVEEATLLELWTLFRKTRYSDKEEPKKVKSPSPKTLKEFRSFLSCNNLREIFPQFNKEQFSKMFGHKSAIFLEDRSPLKEEPSQEEDVLLRNRPSVDVIQVSHNVLTKEDSPLPHRAKPPVER
ncbi:hypothetical protein AGMMS49949_04680 [Alphaproteobacteria bacterium]|nr:hypothetical protein AGMMS49949_04680 [Alphaproteobacteria bacterium]GHS95968.1 hypothetical protein AGMMS50296_1580 [Alphaproteobacteria bacterium]